MTDRPLVARRSGTGWRSMAALPEAMVRVLALPPPPLPMTRWASPCPKQGFEQGVRPLVTPSRPPSTPSRWSGDLESGASEDNLRPQQPVRVRRQGRGRRAGQHDPRQCTWVSGEVRPHSRFRSAHWPASALLGSAPGLLNLEVLFDAGVPSWCRAPGALLPPGPGPGVRKPRPGGTGWWT